MKTKYLLIGFLSGILIAALLFFVVPFPHTTYMAHDSFLGRDVTMPVSYSPLYCVDKNYNGLYVATCSEVSLFNN